MSFWELYGSSFSPDLGKDVTEEEVEAWAEAEADRRQAWLEGPTEWEKLEWARRERRRRRFASLGPAVGPTEEEVEEWAENERKRRQEWAEGPSPADKAEWARKERARRRFGFPRPPFSFDPDQSSVEELQRQIRLAIQGGLAWAWNAPWELWEKAVEAGREWESGVGDAYGPRRVSLYE